MKTKKDKYLGKLIISATDALEKYNKTNEDVKVKCYIEKWRENRKQYKTIGVDVKGIK